MAIVHKVWRAAAIEVPYAERTAGGRTWGSLIPTDNADSAYDNWTYWTTRTDRYGMSFIAEQIEDWAQACGTSVVRLYTDTFHWTSLTSRGYEPGVSFQLLGQDYLDGNYNGDIATHPWVNLLRFRVTPFGPHFDYLGGVECSDIINSNPSASNATESYWTTKYVGEVAKWEYFSSTITDHYDKEVYVSYSDTSGSEYFNVVINAGGGPGSNTATSRTGSWARAGYYNPVAGFGWFRASNVDTTAPGARGNDSGWCIWGSDILSEYYPFILPYNQDGHDSEAYVDKRYPPEQGATDTYTSPYGRLLSDEYNVFDENLAHEMGYSSISTLSSASSHHATGYTRRNEKNVIPTSTTNTAFSHGWMKGAPLYTSRGHRFASMPEGMLIGGRHSNSTTNVGTRAITKIDGSDYFIYPGTLAWRIN